MKHPLRTYRETTGTTLDQIASQVGSHKSTLSKIESFRAKPSLGLVERLVSVTRGAVSADDFLTRETQP